jgi:hypothetical protein
MKEEITDLAEKGRGGGGWRIKTKAKKRGTPSIYSHYGLVIPRAVQRGME